MPDWRINEKYRKPRRTKGTPFFYTRNYWAAGAFAVAGLSWFAFECTPGAKKLRKRIDDGRWDYSEGLQTKIKHLQLGKEHNSVEGLLTKAREREI